MTEIKKLRDGKGNVAVIYSPGYGAGWYTWNTGEPYSTQLVFDPVLAQMILDEKPVKERVEYVEKNYTEDIYCGGLNQAEIEWLPEDTQFYINEYDGSESIRALNNLTLTA